MALLAFAVHILCVIPARLASTRLVRKPLRLVAGEPLIRLVARRVMDFELGWQVVVATDDRQVIDALAGLAIETTLTYPGLRSGTERVAAVLEQPAYRGHDVVVNVQGDEPLIERDAVIGAIERVTRDGYEIGTAAALLERGALNDPNRVKVTVDGRGRALTFFRTPEAPACSRRDATFQHLGVYAYRASAVRRWITLPLGADEGRERLEQLRPLAHGMTIGVAVQPVPAAPGVDSEADLREIERRLAIQPTPGDGPGFSGETTDAGLEPGVLGAAR
jgi:3-deoxy-manno-octulosonate cytidylyltransferase (CMP-KDO synthetase)